MSTGEIQIVMWVLDILMVPIFIICIILCIKIIRTCKRHIKEINNIKRSFNAGEIDFFTAMKQLGTFDKK